MTEKELLYVQDAIDHVKMLISKCEQNESLIKDENLKQFICEIKTRQESIFKNFYNLL